MAYGMTKNANLTDTLPTIIERANLTEQFAEVIAPKCWKITKAKGKGSTVNVPYFGTATASALTEGVDMASPTQMADTNVQITLGEVGVQILLTDNTLEDNQEDILRVAGDIAGAAMAAKKEADLAGQFDDATTSLGGSSTTLTMGELAAARAILSGNAVSAGGPCPGPYSAFLHPYVALDLVDVLTPTVPGGTTPATTPGSLTDRVLAEYTIGKLFGITLYESGNIPIASTSSKGVVMGPKSLIYATAREGKVTTEYDASLRATEINLIARYGVGEYLPGWLIELYQDATTPS